MCPLRALTVPIELITSANGCITATANVNAPAIARLYRDWRSPDAERLQADVDRVRAEYESLPTIAAMKAKLGWPAVRPPLVPLTAEQRGRIPA